LVSGDLQLYEGFNKLIFVISDVKVPLITIKGRNNIIKDRYRFKTNWWELKLSKACGLKDFEGEYSLSKKQLINFAEAYNNCLNINQPIEKFKIPSISPNFSIVFGHGIVGFARFSSTERKRDLFPDDLPSLYSFGASVNLNFNKISLPLSIRTGVHLSRYQHSNSRFKSLIQEEIVGEPTFYNRPRRVDNSYTIDHSFSLTSLRIPITLMLNYGINRFTVTAFGGPILNFNIAGTHINEYYPSPNGTKPKVANKTEQFSISKFQTGQNFGIQWKYNTNSLFYGIGFNFEFYQHLAEIDNGSTSDGLDYIANIYITLGRF
jgi:hypothetical protein